MAFENYTTNQQTKIKEDQIVNNAGGYVFSIDDINYLKRYLVLGVETNNYYVNKNQIFNEASERIKNTIAIKGKEVVDTVVEVLIEGMKKVINHPSPINLAFGSRVTLNQAIDALRLKFPNLKVSYFQERSGDVRNSQNDPTLLKSIFPTITPIDFSKALEKTYQWFIENGASIVNGPRVTD